MSKKDLLLTDEAFPLPIVFEVNKFTIDGIPVTEITTRATGNITTPEHMWVSNRRNSCFVASV